MREAVLVLPVLVIATPSCGGGETQQTHKGQEPSCAAPEVALADGSCIRPGVPLDGCGVGFEHDADYGCDPVLPAGACPSGLMAVPGDTDCRPSSPCADGHWGDIPVDASTVYVDGSYPALDSDGTVQRPFTTVSAAVSAAAVGSLIAIAAGTYSENVIVSSKRLRLWGVCPEKVQIVGSSLSAGCPPAALCIKGALASGTEVHALALTGAGLGLGASGAGDVLVDRVWVHDTGWIGVDVENTWGPIHLSITGSLVEANHHYGIFDMGAELDLDRSVVRGALPRPSVPDGGGIGLELQCSQAADGTLSCDPNAPARASIKSTLIEANYDVGLVAQGSEVTMDASVVRGTSMRASDQGGGQGISIQVPCFSGPNGIVCDASAPSHATVRASIVSDNAADGVRVSGSVATIDTTVVRDQSVRQGVLIRQPCYEPGDGSLVCASTAPSHVTLSSCLIDRNKYVGLAITGAEATIVDTVVRGTEPRPTDMLFGRGVGVEPSCSKLSDGTLVCDLKALGSATIRGSLIAANRGEGLHVADSTATVDTTVVTDTAPRIDGLFGDGIAVVSDGTTAQVSLTNARIERSARAGLSNFGAAASLEAVEIECAGFDLQGERYLGRDTTFYDQGGVRCGCPVAGQACHISSAELAPPTPVGPDR